MKSRIVGASTLIVAAFVLPSQGMAQTASRSGVPTSASQEAPREAKKLLGFGEIAARVEAQGYRDIEEIEREKDGYEVCAKDTQGREVELEVDGATGKVEKVEVCDD